MKKVLALIIALSLIFCIIPTAFAASGSVYYIDSESGNDGNDGLSPTSAWKTLAGASEKTYNPGDSILLKAGCIFNGGFVTKGNGTEDNEITISAYGDTKTLGNPIVRADDNIILIHILNSSYWTVSDIDFTAPEGRGVYITADGKNTVKGITVSGCNFYNIYYRECSYCDHFPISMGSNGLDARLDGITISNCSITKCAFGINMYGITYEWAKDNYISPEISYNRNYLIEGNSLSEIYNDGIIIGSVYGMVIRNCSLINTSTSENHYTAPMWSHHASNYLIENCEIAGSTNINDGMAVDFDGWTTDATYQYIYSHDNARFIRNCCYDNYTCNDNCTVRYCLSVNDNMGENSMAQMLTSSAVDYAEDELPVAMTNFKFYNNTIINASEFYLCGLKDSIIANNIFDGEISTSFLSMRKNLDDEGNAVYRDFDGTVTNNCFSGCSSIVGGKNSILGNPGFVSDDVTDKNSFKLAENSRLIGKGIQVEEDMGETDLYGNKLTDTHNIGCYEGTGEKGELSDFETVMLNIKSFISSLLGTIYNFIDNCNQRYWLF